ncbi:MAG: hypothetical protein V4484_05815, partial [Pseudomonadota bacterium]
SFSGRQTLAADLCITRCPEAVMGFVLKMFAWLSVLGGAIAFFVFLPGEAQPVAAFIPSVTILGAGIAQALLLGALSVIVDYLAIIAAKE